MPSSENGLLSAYALDGKGSGKKLNWDEIRSRPPTADGFLWVHMEVEGTISQKWLLEESGIEPEVCNALLAETTRPRIMEANGALVVFLRGVNLNPGADPDDMVSIRVLAEHDRIISLCHRRLMAVGDIIETIEPGKGPTSPGGFIVRLGERLMARMEPVIENLDERVSELEDTVLSKGETELPGDFSDLRVTLTHLLRYLTPQRDALLELKSKPLSGITKAHRIRLAETSDRSFRYVEDLASLRDRLTIIHDEIRVKSNERLNKTMYLLTLVAAILLPPSLVAGLLGVNVGGIPGAQTPWAFAAVILSVIVLGVIEVWILRRLKFI